VEVFLQPPVQNFISAVGIKFCPALLPRLRGDLRARAPLLPPRLTKGNGELVRHCVVEDVVVDEVVVVVDEVVVVVYVVVVGVVVDEVVVVVVDVVVVGGGGC
jgi:hypothetical protein